MEGCTAQMEGAHCSTHGLIHSSHLAGGAGDGRAKGGGHSARHAAPDAGAGAWAAQQGCQGMGGRPGALLGSAMAELRGEGPGVPGSGGW